MCILKTERIQAKDYTDTHWHRRVKGWAKVASSRYTRRRVRQAPTMDGGLRG